MWPKSRHPESGPPPQAVFRACRASGSAARRRAQRHPAWLLAVRRLQARRRPAWPLLLTVALSGCPRLDMHDQPRQETLESSGFFADGQSARQPVAGTVARGALREDSLYFTGMVNDSTFTSELPFALTLELLQRGRERYGIFCGVCHDAAGTGRGMVVRRGFKPPQSFHSERLREEPVGYFYDVISRGFATMPAFAAQIPPADRWAIVAYVRALQLSQSVALDELPAALRVQAERAASAPGAPAPGVPAPGVSIPAREGTPHD